MCRLMVYCGPPILMQELVTKPTRSITSQALQCMERTQGSVNGDGFGVGWYDEAFTGAHDEPCIFTSIQPAWNNLNLGRLARKVRSPLIFAHVRAAYPGMPVSEVNCHPFVYGRYMWMHNGSIACFSRLRRRLEASLSDELYGMIQGKSDSEAAFALFLQQLPDLKARLPAAELQRAMATTLVRICELVADTRAAGPACADEVSLLNFVLSDGQVILATRFVDAHDAEPATLYYASGTSFAAAPGEAGCEPEYAMHHASRQQATVIVSSEPLSASCHDWLPVPRNSMVTIVPDVAAGAGAGPSLRVLVEGLDGHELWTGPGRGVHRVHEPAGALAAAGGASESPVGMGAGLGMGAGGRAAREGGAERAEPGAAAGWPRPPAPAEAAAQAQPSPGAGLAAEPPRGRIPRLLSLSLERIPVLQSVPPGGDSSPLGGEFALECGAEDEDGRAAVRSSGSGGSSKTYAPSAPHHLFCNADCACGTARGVARAPDAGAAGGGSAGREGPRVLRLQMALRSHAPHSVLCVAAHIPRAGCPLLLTGATDGAVRVWRFDYFECVGVLRGHTRAVHALVGFRPGGDGGADSDGGCADGCDGGSLAGVELAISAAADNSVRVWDISAQVCLLVLATRGMVLTLAIVHVALPTDGPRGSARGGRASAGEGEGKSEGCALRPRPLLCAGCQDTTVKCLALDDVVAAAAAARPSAVANARADELREGADAAMAARQRSLASAAGRAAQKPEEAVPALAPSASFSMGGGEEPVALGSVMAGIRSAGAARRRPPQQAPGARGDPCDGAQPVPLAPICSEGSCAGEYEGGGGSGGEEEEECAAEEAGAPARATPPRPAQRAPPAAPSTPASAPLPAYRMDSLVACTLRGHAGYVLALCACSDRWLCSAGGDGALCLWTRARSEGAADAPPAGASAGGRDGRRLASGPCGFALQHALPAHDGSVLCVAYHASLSLLLSGGADASVRVWECGGAAADAPPLALRSLSGHAAAVSALGATEALLLSADAAGVCRIWDARSLVCLQTHLPGASLRARLPAGAPPNGGGGGPAADGAATSIHALCCALAPALDGGAAPRPRAGGAAAAGGGEAAAAAQRQRAGEGRGGAERPSCPPASPPLLRVVAAAGEAEGGAPLCFLALSTGAVLAYRLSLPDADLLARGGGYGGGYAYAGARGSRRDREGESGGAVAGSGSDSSLAELMSGADLLGADAETHGAAPARLLDGCAPLSAPPRPQVATGLASMLEWLRELVAFPSVSADPAAAPHVLGAASWLRRHLEDMGAETKLVCPRRPTDGPGGGAAGGFPIVLGRIGTDVCRPTIVFYGHYDVVGAAGAGWLTNPFELAVSDGYVRGRGVTDNKGPIVAMLAAVRELLRAREPSPFNFAFALDGEEEIGSVGFEAALAGHTRWLAGEGGVACVLVCNTYWLSDERPSLVYGLRGVVHLDVSVQGGLRSLHSGVHGGAVYEPTLELAALLGTLTQRGSGAVSVAGFRASVRPLVPEEAALYENVDFDSKAYAQRIGAAVRLGGACGGDGEDGGGSRRLLMARWREPCLSINQLSANADSTNFAVIPPSARAHLSVRFVPDQTAAEMVGLVGAHLRAEFAALNTPNALRVSPVGGGEWWLGDPHSPPYQAAARALRSVWGLEPSFIREGGTIPVTSCLERLMGAPAVHLSLGQASDNAHLDNERMSVRALHRGKLVLSAFFAELAALHPRQDEGGAHAQSRAGGEPDSGA